MASFVDFILDGLATAWTAVTSNPIKSTGAIASIGALVVSWKNFKKDTTKVKVTIKRAQDGPLALQKPQEEYFLFEVNNQGTTPVVINQIGIVVRELLRKKRFIDLVNLPHAHTSFGAASGVLGAIEFIEIPGTVPPKSMGVFMLSYSDMRTAALTYQRQEPSPANLNFVGSRRIMNTYQAFQKFQDSQSNSLQAVPYVLTGSGETFIGKKVRVRLGPLSEIVASN